jgi:hypothetical protein
LAQLETPAEKEECADQGERPRYENDPEWALDCRDSIEERESGEHERRDSVTLPPDNHGYKNYCRRKKSHRECYHRSGKTSRFAEGIEGEQAQKEGQAEANDSGCPYSELTPCEPSPVHGIDIHSGRFIVLPVIVCRLTHQAL